MAERVDIEVNFIAKGAEKIVAALRRIYAAYRSVAERILPGRPFTPRVGMLSYFPRTIMAHEAIPPALRAFRRAMVDIRKVVPYFPAEFLTRGFERIYRASRPVAASLVRVGRAMAHGFQTGHGLSRVTRALTYGFVQAGHELNGLSRRFYESMGTMQRWAWRMGFAGYVAQASFRFIQREAMNAWRMFTQMYMVAGNLNQTISYLATSQAYAAQTFGKGSEAANFFNQALQAEIAHGADAMRMFTMFQNVLTALQVIVATATLPAFQRLIEVLIEAASREDLIVALQRLAEVIAQAAEVIIPAMVDAFLMWEPVLEAVIPILAQIIAFLMPILPILMALIQAFMILGPLLQLGTVAGLGFAGTLGAIATVAGPLILIILALIAVWYAWQTNLFGFRDAVIALANTLVWFGESVYWVFTHPLEAIMMFWDTLRALYDWIVNTFSWLVDSLTKTIASGTTQAAEESSQTLADYYEFHSPPRKGPLRRVREWGKGFMAEYLKGVMAVGFPSLQVGPNVATNNITITVEGVTLTGQADVNMFVEELARQLAARTASGGILK